VHQKTGTAALNYLNEIDSSPAKESSDEGGANSRIYFAFNSETACNGM